MPSYRMMEHTRHRFLTMSEQKLWARMGKITNHEKLEAFAIVAEDANMPDLAVAASARLARLSGRKVTALKVKPKTKRGDTGRALRRLDM